MIDFTGLPRHNKTYAGANGNKIAIVYEGAQYMLKFPAPPTRNKEMSYANGCVSEYLGSHIFQMAGIPAQDTLLGVYTKNGRERVVVACRDFTTDGSVLQDFASLKNTRCLRVRISGLRQFFACWLMWRFDYALPVSYFANDHASGPLDAQGGIFCMGSKKGE